MTCVALRMMSASYPAMASAQAVGRELGTEVHLEVPAQQLEAGIGELLRDQDPHGLGLEEHGLGRGHGRAPLHRMSELLQGHLQRRQAADDVELAEVAEVPDPEDPSP